MQKFLRGPRDHEALAVPSRPATLVGEIRDPTAMQSLHPQHGDASVAWRRWGGRKEESGSQVTDGKRDGSGQLPCGLRGAVKEVLLGKGPMEVSQKENVPLVACANGGRS